MTTTTQERVSNEIVENFKGTNVDKFPLSGPEGLATNMYGLWTEDGAYIDWSAVSKGYVPHTVDDVSVMGEAAAIGLDFGDDSKVTTHWNGATHTVVIGPTKEQRRTICGTKDDIFPRVVISAGFSGKGFKCEAGFYRDACTNLSMIRQLSGTSTTIRHTASLRPRIHELADTFRSMAGIWDQTVDFAETLAARRVSTTEFLTKMYPLAESAGAAQVTRYRNRAEKIINRIIRERTAVGIEGDVRNVETCNLWELVNGVTGYIQHDSNRQGEKKTETERALLVLNDSNADRAWNLASTILAA